MKKIGFCFLSHQAHVRHQLPIAVEYSRLHPTDKVDVLFTTQAVLEEIERNLNGYASENFNLILLKGSFLKTVVGKAKGRLYPNTRNVINTNKALFLSYDVLVTPHHTLDRVMELDLDRKIKYICTFHGAGDGEVGFDSRFSAYDLLLTAGEDIYSRLISEKIVHRFNEAAIIGYPKLENIKPITEKCFTDGKVTYLYNPHYEPHLTSWPFWGENVLEWFSKNKTFNLIFAPHVKLFNGTFPSHLEKYLECSNIYIDVSSERMMDATYTSQADVYIGDVSSQVYEFLYFGLKPVIFLNAQGVTGWQEDPNYKMWKMGGVVNSIDTLGILIETCMSTHEICYHAVQEIILKNKFSRTAISAEKRGVAAISDYIFKEKGREKAGSPKRYLLYITQNYSFEILRPIQAEILKRGDECAWFVGSRDVDISQFADDEQVLVTVLETRTYSPCAVLVPGNTVPSFIPGLKVQVFHGLEWKKKGNFRVRDFFDLYCTFGPLTTDKFNCLQAEHKNFTVSETGWSKLDNLFSVSPYQTPVGKKLVLYAPTFSKKLTSLSDAFEVIKALTKKYDWHWLIKLHPLTDKNLVDQYKSLQGSNVEFIEQQSILPLLKSADVLLSDTSSVIGEFSLLEKPVVTLNNSEPEAHLFDVKSPGQIETALISAFKLSDEQIEEIQASNRALHPYSDGNSSQRVLESIDAILEKKIGAERRRPLNLFRNMKLRAKLGFWRLF